MIFFLCSLDVQQLSQYLQGFMYKANNPKGVQGHYLSCEDMLSLNSLEYIFKELYEAIRLNEVISYIDNKEEYTFNKKKYEFAKYLVDFFSHYKIFIQKNFHLKEASWLVKLNLRQECLKVIREKHLENKSIDPLDEIFQYLYTEFLVGLSNKDKTREKYFLIQCLHFIETMNVLEFVEYDHISRYVDQFQ